MSLVALMGLSMAACSDKYMADLNTDPSKAETIDPNAQLTTAILQTYGDLGMVETYRSYNYAFSQHLMGCWNTTNYGGRHTLDNNEMAHVWTSLYANALKNLTDGIYRTTDDLTQLNINSVMRIYRAYLMSIITDMYGDAPCSEAGLGYLESKFNPRYDTQEEIYNWMFTELTEASKNLESGADRVTGDVIYNGTIASWKKLANSLRLRFAMRISDVKPEVAKTQFEAALADGVFTSHNDDALIKYRDVAFSFGQESYTDFRRNAMSQLFFGNDPANNPTFLCSTFFNQLYNTGDPRTFRISRFYCDQLMSLTAPDNRIDLTDEIIANQVKMNPNDPGGWWWEPWPSSYESDIMKELKEIYPNLTTKMAMETRPKLANNFLKGSNPGVVMTFAEVNFLKAEAKLKGWNVTESVEDLYKKGVRESMDFLSNNYGCDPVTDREYEAFIADNGVGHTAEQMKANINTQAWILHFHNPNEAWANVRRADYPKLKSPKDYGFGPYLVNGQEIPLRLLYPVLESSYNKKGYDEAVGRMSEYSWNVAMWWDVNK